MYGRTYFDTYASVCVCVFVFIYIYIFIYVCVYIYIYIYVTSFFVNLRVEEGPSENVPCCVIYVCFWNHISMQLSPCKDYENGEERNLHLL